MEKNEILQIYGTNIAAMAEQLAEAANLAGLIGPATARVGLKPNLVLASPAENGATTHPEVVDGLLRYLGRHGFSNLVVLEGAWVGASTRQAFEVCGIEAVAKKHGVPLVDTQKDAARPVDCAGLEISVCEAALGLDFLINLPVLKGHCQTVLTCALKNAKGLIPNSEKRRFHTLGLHRPIAHLNAALPHGFTLVDNICGDLDFEEGGNPVPTGRLFACRDAVLCDAFAARELGVEPGDIPYIGMAEALGVGSASLAGARVTALNRSPAAGNAPRPTGKAARVAKYIAANSACSACQAALTRALCQLSATQLAALPGPVCIGQGYAKAGAPRGAVGVGRCTAGCARHLGGCPPAAADIAAFLRGAGR